MLEPRGCVLIRPAPEGGEPRSPGQRPSSFYTSMGRVPASGEADDSSPEWFELPALNGRDCCPEGAEQLSPGQRPGFGDRSEIQALKGRHTALRNAANAGPRVHLRDPEPEGPASDPASKRCDLGRPFRAWIDDHSRDPGRCPGLSYCALSGQESRPFGSEMLSPPEPESSATPVAGTQPGDM